MSNTDKNILVVVRLLSSFGGLHSFLYSLLPALKRKGFTVHLAIYTNQSFHEVFKKYFSEHSIFFLAPPKITNFFGLFHLRKIVKQNNINVVYAQDIFESILIRPLKIFSPALRCCATIHSNFREMVGDRRVVVSAIFAANKLTQRWLDKFICVSNYIRDHLISEGIAREKTLVIYNGILIPKEIPRRKTRIFRDCDHIGFVGRLSFEKGVDVFLEVAKSLKGSGLMFHIFGDGPMNPIVIKAVAENPHIIYHGIEYDKTKIFTLIDLIVLPSRSEGFPYAVLESFFYEVIVVANNAGGLPELVRENGFLIEHNNVTAYKKIIEEVRHNVNKRIDHIEKGKKFLMTNGNVESMCAKYANFFLMK